MTKVGHIYLIDDDESMRTSLSRMLKDVGYIVDDFSSAVTFLEHSVPVAPAVILLDMQMPDATIKVHKARVMDKMNVDSVQLLVAKYLESDLENLQNG
ncbi:response regulator [Polynucleobacter sp. 71A-WALBACH]|uniref:response regulator n=1 Tax=Polynucleobacter sp. 71A-WALBACH TaxID=2689097 RepID=UPI0021076400|nr:response regulator [Polynucleobacter sp. 71A-WALBACH]MBU3593576.1 response regulator [Polynucleobacter sp. 71A-WALBACH]